MYRRFLPIAGITTTLIALGVFSLSNTAFAAASIESLKLTGPNTITVVYSQPVYTSPSDYTNFTGAFQGETVTSLTGSGSNTIVLTLSGSVSANASGYVTIGTNVQDVSDGSYFPGSTWNIIDGIGPAITSIQLGSNENNGSFLGTNNTLTVTFYTNEQVNILNMTILGHPISVSGSGTGAFTGTYTMQSSDNQQSVPVTLTIADNSNNQTSVSMTFGANSGTTAVTNGANVISSISSNANTTGVLTNGDSITFTLTPETTEPNAHINGSYNGVPLTWVSTNGGINYVATYVVAAGQPSQSAPLQISGVTLTDQNGNVSAPASGYDIQKTISVSGTASTDTTTDTTVSTDVTSEIASLESQLAALQSQVSGGTATATSTVTPYDFTEFLGVGSQGAEVTALQERLTADGDYSGPITGFYGSLTQAAVSKFQAAHGIDVFGYVGPATRAALNAE